MANEGRATYEIFAGGPLSPFMVTVCPSTHRGTLYAVEGRLTARDFDGPDDAALGTGSASDKDTDAESDADTDTNTDTNTDTKPPDVDEDEDQDDDEDQSSAARFGRFMFHVLSNIEHGDTLQPVADIPFEAVYVANDTQHRGACCGTSPEGHAILFRQHHGVYVAIVGRKVQAFSLLPGDEFEVRTVACPPSQS
jgi:hypothetical protein